MSRIAALFLVCLAFAVPAQAADEARPYAQVPLIPLTAEMSDDVSALVWALWPSYYNASGENAFRRDNLRMGRIDLDNDDRPELVLMIDAPGWEAEQGNPFVIAQWRKKRWVAVGWGWGDEDTVFATTEMLGGWRSIDSGHQVLRWIGKEYRIEEKLAP